MLSLGFMQARPTQPPDLIANIRVLPEQRAQFVSDGIATGFRAAHDFRLPDKELNDALHFIVGRDFLPLERRRTRVSALREL